MNKLYILICAIVLSGCSPYTLEEVEKAKVYCKQHATDPIIVVNGFDEPIIMKCKLNGVIYAIPKEALK